MKIKADVKYIRRVKITCPDDGVHVSGKDGCIKGVHSLWFNDRLVPKGANAFYWKLDDQKGVKVFYSFGWFKQSSRKIANLEMQNMMKLYLSGISPKPYDICNVKLDLNYEGKTIRETALGLVIENVNYPEEAWKKYAEGYPYDWNAIKESWHTPEEFTKFRDSTMEKIDSLKIKFSGSGKLGDILPDTIKKRWFLVDAT